MENEVFETVELMAQNERHIRDLYALFAKKIPEHDDFWNTISCEEELHAQSILFFLEEAKNGEVELKPKRFKKEAIKFYSDYILRKTKAAKSAYVPSHKDALKLSLEIEQIMIEKNFFEVFATDTSILKDLLDDLRVHTQEHILRIEKEIDKSQS